MYIKTSEFTAIEHALKLLPSGEEFYSLPLYEQNIILAADICMVNIFQRHLKKNAKTAQYIAKKRETDKNYARPKTP